jgi:hypothetical protein
MTTRLAQRMIAAELLKLRRRRGLFWWSLVLTSGAVVTIFTTLAILHLEDPGHYGPAGGASNFGHAMEGLTGLAGVVSIMIGATAGAGDLSAGVFRDMVTTGRSRVTLFLVRLPGALALQLPLVVGAIALATAASLALAGGQRVPDAGLIAHYGAWVLVSTVLDLVLALGLASLLGSRATTIGVLLAWEVVASPLLEQISFLGNLRDGISATAIDQLRPGGEHLLSMPLAAACLVIAGWVALALGAGAWRTRSLDA